MWLWPFDVIFPFYVILKILLVFERQAPYGCMLFCFVIPKIYTARFVSSKHCSQNLGLESWTKQKSSYPELMVHGKNYYRNITSFKPQNKAARIHLFISQVRNEEGRLADVVRLTHRTRARAPASLSCCTGRLRSRAYTACTFLRTLISGFEISAYFLVLDHQIVTICQKGVLCLEKKTEEKL